LQVLVLGDRTSIYKFTGTVIPDMGFVGLSELAQAMDLLEHEAIDIVVVNSQKEDAMECCKRLKESYDVAVALIVRAKTVNWREISYLTIDGFIPEDSSRDELIARLHAIYRRSKPQ
jgi:DNA-binding response OmpR family regulator